MSHRPILIWGAGAIGGTVGAYLQRAGDAVQFESVAVETARAELFAALRTVRASLAATFPLGGADLSSEFLLSQNLISGAQSAAEES